MDLISWNLGKLAEKRPRFIQSLQFSDQTSKSWTKAYESFVFIYRPPTNWTTIKSDKARQALSFEDFDMKQTIENETLSQQLKMLLKVQA